MKYSYLNRMLLALLFALSYSVAANSQTFSSLENDAGWYSFEDTLICGPADDFISNHTSDLGLSNSDRFETNGQTWLDSSTGYTISRYYQFHNGIRVYGAGATVTEHHNRIFSVMGNWIPDLDYDAEDTILASTALVTALLKFDSVLFLWDDSLAEATIKDELGDTLATYKPTGELVILPGVNDTALCWRFDVTFQDSSDTSTYIYEVYVHAEEDTVFDVIDLTRDCSHTVGHCQTLFNGAQANLHIDKHLPWNYRLKNCQDNIVTRKFDSWSVFSANPNWTHSGTNWGTTHRLATSIHWAANWTHDYFDNTWNLDGPDDDGEKIRILVGKARTGAEFVPESNPRIQFQNVNGLNLASLDIVGHEYTHWVIHRSSKLAPRGESGALEESFCDVFGTAVERFAKGGSFDWEMGGEVTSNGEGLRDLEDRDAFTGFPDQSQEVGDDEFVDPNDLDNDNGGVHINCGIPSKVFQRLVDGSTSVPAIGWDKAINIWYRTMRRVQSTSTFRQARNVSLEVTRELHGSCSDEMWSLRASWALAGVGSWPARCVSIGRGSQMFAIDPLQNDTVELVAHTKDTAGIIYGWEMPAVGFDTLDSSATIWMVPPGLGTYLIKVAVFGTSDTLYDSVYLYIRAPSEPICSVGIVNKVEKDRFVETLSTEGNAFIGVYPNPAGKHIQLSGLKSELIYYVTLYSLHGEELVNSPIRKGESISIEGYPSGLYYLAIQGNGINHTERLLIK